MLYFSVFVSSSTDSPAPSIGHSPSEPSSSLPSVASSVSGTLASSNLILDATKKLKLNSTIGGGGGGASSSVSSVTTSFSPEATNRNIQQQQQTNLNQINNNNTATTASSNGHALPSPVPPSSSTSSSSPFLPQPHPQPQPPPSKKLKSRTNLSDKFHSLTSILNLRDEHHDRSEILQATITRLTQLESQVAQLSNTGMIHGFPLLSTCTNLDHVAVSYLTLDGKFADANRTFLNLFGFPGVLGATHIRSGHGGGHTRPQTPSHAAGSGVGEQSPELLQLRKHTFLTLSSPYDVTKLSRLLTAFLQNGVPTGTCIETRLTFVDFSGNTMERCSCVFSALRKNGVLKLLMVMVVPGEFSSDSIPQQTPLGTTPTVSSLSLNAMSHLSPLSIGVGPTGVIGGIMPLTSSGATNMTGVGGVGGGGVAPYQTLPNGHHLLQQQQQQSFATNLNQAPSSATYLQHARQLQNASRPYGFLPQHAPPTPTPTTTIPNTFNGGSGLTGGAGGAVGGGFFQPTSATINNGAGFDYMAMQHQQQQQQYNVVQQQPQPQQPASLLYPPGQSTSGFLPPYAPPHAQPPPMSQSGYGVNMLTQPNLSPPPTTTPIGLNNGGGAFGGYMQNQQTQQQAQNQPYVHSNLATLQQHPHQLTMPTDPTPWLQVGQSGYPSHHPGGVVDVSAAGQPQSHLIQPYATMNGTNAFHQDAMVPTMIVKLEPIDTEPAKQQQQQYHQQQHQQQHHQQTIFPSESHVGLLPSVGVVGLVDGRSVSSGSSVSSASTSSNPPIHPIGGGVTIYAPQAATAAAGAAAAPSTSMTANAPTKTINKKRVVMATIIPED